MGSRTFSRIAVRVLALAAFVLLLSGCSDQPTAPESGETPLTIQAAVGTDPVSGAAIETNQDDYLPGEIVHLTGWGWAPNETVRLFMTEDPDTHDDVTQDVQADSTGGFSIHFYDVQEHDLGVTFTLTATGLASGSSAIAVFTDNRVITKAELLDPSTAAFVTLTQPPAAPVPVTVGPEDSVTTRITGTTNDMGTGPAWESTGWQIFDNTNTVVASGCNNGVSVASATIGATHTFKIGAPELAGTYRLSFVAYRLDGCTGSGSSATQNSPGALIVEPPADDEPPVVTNVQASPNPTNGTVNVVLTATATDLASNIASAEYNIDGGAFSAMAASDGAFDGLAEDVTVTIAAATIAALADGNHTLCVRATDTEGNASADDTACTTLLVDQTPPAISNFLVSPNPVAVNASFTISATFTDALTNVTGAEYSLGGIGGTWIALPSAAGTSPYGDSQTENGTITLILSSADVLDVCVRSTDQVGNTNQATGTNPIQCVLLAVYDPSAGFVTGGGWIDSPEGACNWTDCQYTTVGKATFGFVSKYHKGANVPSGNTEFQFRAGNLNFASSNYEWLVVSQGGSRAQYKGYGTINGQAGYGFLLTALDETPDRFRIKIWSTSTNAVVYDNRMGDADSGDTGTVLGGGSIIIHVPKK